MISFFDQQQPFQISTLTAFADNSSSLVVLSLCVHDTNLAIEAPAVVDTSDEPLNEQQQSTTSAGSGPTLKSGTEAFFQAVQAELRGMPSEAILDLEVTQEYASTLLPFVQLAPLASKATPTPLTTTSSIASSASGSDVNNSNKHNFQVNNSDKRIVSTVGDAWGVVKGVGARMKASSSQHSQSVRVVCLMAVANAQVFGVEL
jgi:hypothetical protein